MHTNVSISETARTCFWDAKGEEKLSKLGYAFIDRILTHGMMSVSCSNASVNAYRRPRSPFRGPDQIKASRPIAAR